MISLFANSDIQDEVQKEVDCLILEDEDSIICKYILPREEFDKRVQFDWIAPNGELSRSRELNVSAGHGSVYDFRYIKGREPGIWTLKVTDGNETYNTNFQLK